MNKAYLIIYFDAKLCQVINMLTPRKLRQSRSDMPEVVTNEKVRHLKHIKYINGSWKLLPIFLTRKFYCVPL